GTDEAVPDGLAPADEVTSDEEAAPAEEPEASGVAESVAEDAEERAPRRRRSGRRSSRAGRSAQDSGADDEAAGDVVEVAEPAKAPGKPRTEAPLDVLAELGPVRTEEEPPSRARLATTALLFQAP